MSEKLTNPDHREKLLVLLRGLLIGLEIKTKEGLRLKLSESLRLCYIGTDQDENEHLIGIWSDGFVDLHHFENILDNISSDEWDAFVSNVGLNRLNEKYPLITGGLVK